MIYIDDKGKLNLSRLHEGQKEFVKSNFLHTGIVGGYQSGKSASAQVKIVTKTLINPGVPSAYYLPNYRLISDMLVPGLKRIYESIGIPYDYNQKDSKFTTRYGEIWMRSMDNPDSIVSYSVGYSIIDEADLVHKNKRTEAMQRITSRNSFKKNTPNCIDYVSTPEGYGEMYNFFIKKANDNKKLIRLSTLDNENNLGSGYVDGLRERYTPQQLQAYFHGEFVNLTSGSVFNEYDREKHKTLREIKQGDVLHVGIDFNITNMSAVIHVIEGDVMYAVAEVVGAFDTRALGTILKETFVGHSIVCYPDAAGNARSTSGLTDIQVLKTFGFSIRMLSKNPFVKDRINHMNNILYKQKYFVNYNTCPNYSDALMQLAYKNGQPDKTSGLDHVTDAGTYCCWHQRKLTISIR